MGYRSRGGWVRLIIQKESHTVTTVMPEGDAIRKAVKWISAQLQENPEESPQKLVQKAVSRFDLSPKEAEFLIGFYRSGKAGTASDS